MLTGQRNLQKETSPRAGAQTAPHVSPLSLVRMLWKAKVCAVICWTVLSSLAVIIVLRLPTIYRAETLIIVDSQKIPEKFVSATVGTETQDRLATISQRVLSNTQLKKTIEDFRLYREEQRTIAEEEVLERMRRDIDVKLERGWTGGRPGAFRIAYKGSSPEVVAEVTNRLAGLFIDENLRTREVQAEGTTEFIDNQLQEAKRKLDQLEKSVSEYKLRHNGELPQQENSLSGTLARLNTELQGNQDAISRAQQNKTMLESALSMAEAAQSELERSAADAASPTSKPARTSAGMTAAPPKRSEVLQQTLDQMRVRYNDAHPDVISLREAIVQAQHKEEEDRLRLAQAVATESSAPGQARIPRGLETPAILEARQRVAMLRTQAKLAADEIQARGIDRARILRDTTQYQARLERLPVREQEMASLLRDYEVSKTNYRTLLDKKIAAEMASDMEKRQKAERFTVVDPARAPEKPFKPNRPVFAVVGCGLSLMIALAISIGKEFRKGVFLGEWELPPGLPVLGRIPRIETDKRENGIRRWRFALVAGGCVILLLVAAGAAYHFLYRQA